MTQSKVENYNLLIQWKERLKLFLDDPLDIKGMDEFVLIGIQQGRINTLRQCIQELEYDLQNRND